MKSVVSLLSIIVPAYNEHLLVEKNTILIKKKMDSIKKKTGEGYEIIIVEESSDRTPEICSRLASKYRVIRHIHSDVRLGKGGAIEKAIKAARGDTIIFMDIDLSTSLDITEEVLGKMNEYDIVVASRYNPSATVRRSFARALAGSSFSVMLRLLFSTKLRDTKCGYKAFDKKLAERVMKHVGNKGWFWDTEFLMYAEKMGYTVHEIPIEWYERKESNVFIVDNIVDMLNNLARLYVKFHLKKHSPKKSAANS